MMPSAMQEYSKIHEFECWVILTVGLVFCLKFAKVSIVLRVYHTIEIHEPAKPANARDDKGLFIEFRR